MSTMLMIIAALLFQSVFLFDAGNIREPKVKKNVG